MSGVVSWAAASVVAGDVEGSAMAAEHSESQSQMRAYYQIRFVVREDLIRVDRKSTRLNSSHSGESRMPSSA